MTQQALRSGFDLLLYAKTVRARSGRSLGIAAIAAFFITCAIIDAFASTAALAFSDWPSRAFVEEAAKHPRSQECSG